MTKYKTKPIDYTGCHPVIAEHLKRGEAILCKCEDKLCDYDVYIQAYVADSPYPYRAINYGFKNVSPIETKARVKKASEIVKWLEDNGYENWGNHGWFKDNGKPSNFNCEMFRYCGLTPNTIYNWHPDWIEEI